MLLFIVFDNGAAKAHAANSTSFGGILSNSEAVFGINLFEHFFC